MKSYMRMLAIAVPLCAITHAHAQTATFSEIEVPTPFESFSLSMPSVDSTHHFASGVGIFTLYKASWGGFTGFDISRATDTVTNSWTNDKAAITGSGYEDSQYAIGYLSSNFPTLPEESLVYNFTIDHSTATHKVQSMQVTNATWTYRWIQDNMDTVTHLTLYIHGYKNGIKDSDSVIVDLYKKTGTDTILLRDWTTVNLSTLGLSDSITLQLRSNHSWIPFYVAIDEIEIEEFYCEDNLSEVTVSGITKNSAVYNQVITDADIYIGTEIVVNQNATTDPTVAGTFISTNTHSIPSLDSSTDYVLHYRLLCVDSVWSDWDYVEFRTLGDPLSLDYHGSVRNETFIISPNPARTNINVHTNLRAGMRYEIIDVLGKKINAGKAEQMIDVSYLQDGLFFLIIRDKENKIVARSTFIKKN